VIHRVGLWLQETSQLCTFVPRHLSSWCMSNCHQLPQKGLAGSFFIHPDFIHAAKLCIFLFWPCCTSRVNTQHCHLLGHLWVYYRLWYDVHASDWRKSGCVVRFKLHKKERLVQKIFLKGLSHPDVAFCFVIRSVCDWLLNRRRRRSLRHSGSANSKNLRSWVPLCISNNFVYTFWMKPLDIWI
jgi:hypothetical protein